MRRPLRRILYVAFSWPHERCSGYNFRTLQVARALKEVGDVSLAVASPNERAESVARAASEFQICGSMRVRPLALRGLRDRMRWVFDPLFLNLFGWVGEEHARVGVCESLRHFDLIWIGGLRVANVFELWRWPRSMLDIDDVPSALELTKWRSGHQVTDRLKAGIRAFAWRRRENLLLERFTTLGVCSEADHQYLGGGSRIHVIPNGFERPISELRRKPGKPPRIGFIGPFGHTPNLEGVRWFMRSCWARIKHDVPDVRLRLVGKDTDGPLKPVDPDVDGLGWLADPQEEIATWSAMIVPIRVGGGTRLKVAEALSCKCPLVSTRLGAFGYDLADEKEILLADTPEAFARACSRMILEPAEASEMADRAWRQFLDNWTWDAIAPRVWAAAEHCLSLSAGGFGRANLAAHGG